MVLVVFLFAFLVRLTSLLASGGFDSILGYDDGVYFSASSAFIHGLFPYQDFVLVHPPGILLILAPFTWLASFTSDAFGLYAARVFFMMLGATSAVLIYLIARRFNRTAALIAGAFYAVWTPVVRVERTAYLEGIGSLALLISLYLLPRVKTAKTRVALSGAVLGFAVATKLWFAVPVVVIFLWFLFSREIKRALLFGACALGSFLVIVGPFWYGAGSKFWQLVFTAQINRGGSYIPISSRFDQIFNFASLSFIRNPGLRFIIGAVIVSLVTVPFVRFFKKREQGILILALFFAQLIVLFQTPVFFNAYPSFVGATLALIAGITLGELHRNIVTGLVIVAMVALGFSGSLTQAPGRDLPTKIELLPLQQSRCVTSDDPILLVLTNSLTKDLRNGCNLIFDVTGVIYGIAGGRNPNHSSSTARRLESEQYQKEVERYLSSGSVVILGRAKSNGLRRDTIKLLEKNRTVTRANSFVIIS